MRNEIEAGTVPMTSPAEMDGSDATNATAETPPRQEGWQNYVELRRMLRALGDEVRLNIVHALASGERAESGTGGTGGMNVTDLVELLAVSQPLISWHLGALRRTGLVRTERIGREVYCTLDFPRYRLCLRLLGKVLEPGKQSETDEPAATPDANVTAVHGLLPRRARRLRASASPAQPAPGTPDPW